VDEVDFLNMSMTSGAGRTYRFYTKTPLWPFGYGLSYSHFTIALTKSSGESVLTTKYADNAAPSFDVHVTNAGSMDADEVVQAYFVPANITVGRPAPLPFKQLIDFQRVHVKAGESTTVTFTVPRAALAVTDADGNLVSAPGLYTLMFTNGVDQTETHDLTLIGEEQTVEPYPQ